MSADNFRSFVVVNPWSAGGRTRKRWPRMSSALQQALGPFAHAFTSAPEHATALARQALSEGYEMVIAVGGDGTFNEVSNGFFDAGKATHPDAVMGLLPAGTGCDLPRTMGTPRDWQKAIPVLSGRTTRTIDVGHMHYNDHDGVERERVFLNVLSFGVGGEIAHTIKNTSNLLPSKLAFIVATVKGLARYKDRKVKVVVDGGAAQDLSITNYCVCNAQYFGAGMWVAPEAKPDDGRFDLTVWSGFRTRDFVVKQRIIYNGQHVNDPGTTTGHAVSVHATSSERVLLDCDGENPGTLPVRVQVVPKALRVKV